MKFMVIVKADAASEAGRLPTTELMVAMQRFNEELVRAGVLLAAEGLHPSSRGARVKISGTQRSVIRGPFAEDGLVSGFWLLQLRSMDEAIEWVKRCPRPHVGAAEPELEIRQVFEAADFEGLVPPEVLATEERLGREAGGHGV